MAALKLCPAFDGAVIDFQATDRYSLEHSEAPATKRRLVRELLRLMQSREPSPELFGSEGITLTKSGP